MCLGGDVLKPMLWRKCLSRELFDSMKDPFAGFLGVFICFCDAFCGMSSFFVFCVGIRDVERATAAL